MAEVHAAVEHHFRGEFTQKEKQNFTYFLSFICNSTLYQEMPFFFSQGFCGFLKVESLSKQKAWNVKIKHFGKFSFLISAKCKQNFGMLIEHWETIISEEHEDGF